MPNPPAISTASQPESQRSGSGITGAGEQAGESALRNASANRVQAGHNAADQGDDEIDLRQLRHHTKNALQRIMALISQASGLCDTPEGENFVRELEHRIGLSAEVSNALFGLTRAPGTMAARLQTLGESVIGLMRDPGQRIVLDVTVTGHCPPALRESVLRITNELVGNAVKHGMRGRASGRITVRLDSGARRRTRLWVIDDGWGISGRPREGEGLSVANGLAGQHNGTLRLWSDFGTVAVLDLPHADSGRAG